MRWARSWKHSRLGDPFAARRPYRYGMGDAYFTNDSVIRRVYRERALALAGPRALLMQAAHPLAVAGLLAHTGALDRPYERLARTAEVMSTVTFGTRAEADRATRHVRAMHQRVR